MTARWLTSLAEFAANAGRWDAAVAGAGGDNPFLLSSFLLTWAESFAAPASVRVLVVERDDALVAGLPLFVSHRRHGGLRWRALRPLGLGFANLTEPFAAIPEPEFAAQAERALRALPGWDYCSLPLARHPWWQTTTLSQRTRRAGSAARLRADRPAAEYRATLRPHMQANLRRAERRAAEWGAVELHRASDDATLADLIAFQLRHNGSARYAPERELGATPAAWDGFVRTLLPRLAARGALDAMGLRFGGALAAVGFGFRYGAGYKSMLTGYDRRFASAAPGLLLFDRLVDWCAAQGGVWLDMYADGDRFDKRRWCHEFTPLYHGRIFAPTARGRVLRAAARA